MNTADLGYIAIGIGIALVIKVIVSWIEATILIRETRERMEQPIQQYSPEYAHNVMEREAQRVERPLYERSVPGVVMAVREADIDAAHLVVNAKPGSVVVLEKG